MFLPGGIPFWKTLPIPSPIPQSYIYDTNYALQLPSPLTPTGAGTHFENLLEKGEKDCLSPCEAKQARYDGNLNLQYSSVQRVNSITHLNADEKQEKVSQYSLSSSNELKFGVERLLKDESTGKNVEKDGEPSAATPTARDSGSPVGFHQEESLPSSRDAFLLHAPSSLQRHCICPCSTECSQVQGFHCTSGTYRHESQAQQFLPFASVLSGTLPLMGIKVPPTRSNATHSSTSAPSHPSPPREAGMTRRKRSWTRAVFSNLQRKGLEKRFVLQKYITKPDRRQLAATLGLTDAQVKVWFQNRRMKWRHSELKKAKKLEEGRGFSPQMSPLSPSIQDLQEPVISSQSSKVLSSEEESASEEQYLEKDKNVCLKSVLSK